MTKRNKIGIPELLAPAGDAESFYAAVNNGADAVYLGLNAFNARMKAENFNASNLRSFIEYAHFYGVKVYVAINTLLRNNEFIELIEQVKVAVASKVDAFILQDVGAARALYKCFPSIVMHASTQMGIHNLDGALQAEKLGFKRVILSRETKIEDIREIAANTSLELEFFVHGALCVCFSGNCYLSEEELNQSGNRGLCKQLCRLPYTAETVRGEKSGYLLSAKDLCLIENLGELKEAGIGSFKIEGRLRRPGYVGVAVSAYRKAIDAKFRNESVSLNEEKRKLHAAFNRGFLESAYLYGIPEVINPQAQSHSGLNIGKVAQVKPFKDIYEITVASVHPLRKGDGLKFFDNGAEKASLGVGNVTEEGKDIYKIYSKAKVGAGNDVSLTLDSEEEQRVIAASKTIPIVIKAKLTAGEKPIITAYCDAVKDKEKDSDSERVCVKVTGKDALERAINAPADKEYIENQLGKFGSTGFCVKSIETETNGVFIARSCLNALRRELTKKLRAEIISRNEREIKASFDARAYSELLGELRSDNSSNHKTGFKNNCEASVLRFKNGISSGVSNAGDISVISPVDYSVKGINSELERAGGSGSFALELPNFATGEDVNAIKTLLKQFKQFEYLIAQNIYAIGFAASGYKIIAGALLNVDNAQSVRAYSEAGVFGFQNTDKFLYPDNTRVFSAFNYSKPLMTLIHCPFKTLYKCDCTHCAYSGDLKLKRAGREYIVRRVRIKNCYFKLYPY